MVRFVTGGAGFIGSNFIFYILEKYPQDRLVCIDKLTYAGNLSTLAPVLDKPNFRFAKLDICDRDAIYGLFEEEKPDVVINFAAESHVDRSIDNPAIFLETNIIGTAVLMDACRKYGNVRFHQVSTDEVYGDLPLDRPDLFFTEETPIHTSSPYSSSKASADLLAMAYLRTYGLPVTVSRCSNNYGPYQFPEKLIPLIILNCLDGKPLPVYGKGANVRDWLYVEDHCKAVDLVVNSGKIGEVYNIGTSSSSYQFNAGIGEQGSGYLEIRGGKHTLVGQWTVSANYQGHGVLALYDGTLNHISGGSSYSHLYLRGAGTAAAFYQFGGTAEMGTVALNVWTKPSVFAVYGPNATFSGSVKGAWQSASLPTLPGVVTFGGGAKISARLSNAANSSTSYSKLVTVYNFNGVTAKMLGDWSGTLDGAIVWTNSARYVIHQGGLTLDANGHKDIVVNPILGSTGNGVVSVSWNRDATYDACPVVTIEETGGGAGFGASAVAKYDPVSKKVTDIVIVSPGCDYTEATAYFLYNDVKKDALETSIAPNAKDGGLKVINSAGGQDAGVYLRSAGRNTWKGATELAGGTLYCQTAQPPPDTALRLTGGRLYVMSELQATPTFRSIGGTAGSIVCAATNRFEVATIDNDTASTLDLSSFTLSVTGRWDVATSDLVAGRHADYKSAVEFAEGSSLLVAGDLDTAVPKRLTVLKATSIAGAPEFADQAVAQKWKLVLKNNQLDMVRRDGLMLICR